MKLITKNIDYAVQSLLYIAKNNNNVVSALDLSRNLDVPWSFLRRILQVLAKKEVIVPLKGKHGGFKLNKKPEEITLFSIIEVFQGEFSLIECFIKGNLCKRIENCALRREVKDIENIVSRKLKNITIKSLLLSYNNSDLVTENYLKKGDN